MKKKKKIVFSWEPIISIKSLLSLFLYNFFLFLFLSGWGLNICLLVSNGSCYKSQSSTFFLCSWAASPAEFLAAVWQQQQRMAQDHLIHFIAVKFNFHEPSSFHYFTFSFCLFLFYSKRLWKRNTHTIWWSGTSWKLSEWVNSLRLLFWQSSTNSHLDPTYFTIHT